MKQEEEQEEGKEEQEEEEKEHIICLSLAGNWNASALVSGAYRYGH